MTADEITREEHLCVVMEGCKVSYEEAVKIVDQCQGELFTMNERGQK
jgi:hypothetical protein